MGRVTFMPNMILTLKRIGESACTVSKGSCILFKVLQSSQKRLMISSMFFGTAFLGSGCNGTYQKQSQTFPKVNHQVEHDKLSQNTLGVSLLLTKKLINFLLNVCVASKYLSSLSFVTKFHKNLATKVAILINDVMYS